MPPSTRLSILVGLLVAAGALRGIAQEPADGEAITERLAAPYSIDLLPDDPAPGGRARPRGAPIRSAARR